MRQFYTGFKEYLPNPFFIIGVSYGGIYGPYLTWAIHNYNEELKLHQNASKPRKEEDPFMGSLPNLMQEQINIKGFLAANGATDYETDPFISTVDAAYAFGLFSLSWYKSYNENKCKNYWPLMHKESYLPGPCIDLSETLMQRFKEVNIYDLLEAYDLPLENNGKPL